MDVKGRKRQKKAAGTPKRARRGFSLLELLAVMSIMAMLSTLAVTSYFGAIRGMASRGAKKHFQNTLLLARQRACIDGARVSLMAFNEVGSYESDGATVKEWVPSYVVCKELGRVSFVSGNYLFDEFSDLKQLFGTAPDGESSDIGRVGGIRLYNLTSGFWTLVKPFVAQRSVGGSNSKLMYSGLTHSFKAYSFEKQTGAGSQSAGTGTWKVGDAYGVEVAPIQTLPKGFTFDQLSQNASAVHYVTFEPDGSVKQAKTFTIQGSKAAGGGSFRFTVSKEGTITN